MTAVESRADVSVLGVRIDLGEHPSVGEVETQLWAIRELWMYAETLEVLRTDVLPELMIPPLVTGRGSSDEMARRFFLLKREVIDRERELVVVRMRIESPMEVLLAVIQAVPPWGAVTLAGMVALRGLLKMVMAWQKHRIEIRRGELELERERADLEWRRTLREEAQRNLLSKADAWQILADHGTGQRVAHGDSLTGDVEPDISTAAERYTHPCAPADRAVTALDRVDDVWIGQAPSG